MGYLIIGSVLLVITLIIFYVIATKNKFAKLRTMVDEAFSLMDVYLEKRWDLLPKLKDMIKEWSKHEYSTLVDVASRNNYKSLDQDVKIKENVVVDKFVGRFIHEDYPELKAIEGYLDVMETIKNIENEIADARKYYNGVVKVYNTKVRIFPSNIIAKSFKFSECKMYERGSEEKNH